MKEAWLLKLHARLLCWLADRRDVQALTWHMEYVTRMLERQSADPYPFLCKWAHAKHWILRFMAGRECPRCYQKQAEEVKRLLYQLAKDSDFRVREGVAWGGLAILRTDFASGWQWLSRWSQDEVPEVRQTLAMILLPFVREQSLPAYTEKIVQQIRTDQHKIVRMITTRWETKSYV
ncbi:HEAT repeat domain-containing protein [Thermoflavimicrobium dichotomicum]|uniref:HEAT repeat-containing protein n=1 Tax=Thermoflavimicrobium dichotomicum TaxID=46223 RepID=A0A1I3PJN3_9BACL|nr:HEAT repeat domain-containing protein [Thermoflavimicrobium dichotomicum]SFJ21884.1 hypothetical protein SAMN05421852_1065 [Thermoflavimicrobium dichotomicum]